MYACGLIPVQAWAHMCAQLTAFTDWQGACLGTPAFRNTHRRRQWEVESESSEQSCGWCFCPGFRCSALCFQQGNVWGVARPGLHLKGQCAGPFLASAPSLHLLSNWPPPSCVSSGLFLLPTDLALSASKSPQVGQGKPKGALTS